MSTMKVVQVNTIVGKGSTGRICVDIAQDLEELEVETTIAYSIGVPNYKHTYRIGTAIESKIHNLIFSRILGKQGYGSIFATLRFVRFLRKYHPDIVHLNNVHGNYLNYPMLLNYLIKADIPIVWTMHDCWVYTGKCAHYVNANCLKWKNGCNNCPNVKAYPPSYFFDRSDELYRAKKTLFSKLRRCTFIAVSNWIKEEAEQSIISHLNIKRIYNWIDTVTFSSNASDRETLRNYGADPTKFLILGVCGRFSKAKGYDSWKYLSEHLPDDCQIIMVGNADTNPIPNNIIHIPYVSSPSDLATIYASVDVFCNLSEAESFGKTTAEALSCGTPIIVYNTTACPELVGDNCGFVCVKNNASQVLERLLEIKCIGKYQFSESCRSFAESNFSKKNIKDFYTVYLQLLNQSTNGK